MMDDDDDDDNDDDNDDDDDDDDDDDLTRDNDALEADTILGHLARMCGENGNQSAHAVPLDKLGHVLQVPAHVHGHVLLMLALSPCSLCPPIMLLHRAVWVWRHANPEKARAPRARGAFHQ
jgi:hypothetical protein